MKEHYQSRQAQSDIPPGSAQEAQIRIDGFAQVLEMLKIADPEFRESLLRRLAARDRELAIQLKKSLGI